MELVGLLELVGLAALVGLFELVGLAALVGLFELVGLDALSGLLDPGITNLLLILGSSILFV